MHCLVHCKTLDNYGKDIRLFAHALPHLWLALENFPRASDDG